MCGLQLHKAHAREFLEMQSSQLRTEIIFHTYICALPCIAYRQCTVILSPIHTVTPGAGGGEHRYSKPLKLNYVCFWSVRSLKRVCECKRRELNRKNVSPRILKIPILTPFQCGYNNSYTIITPFNPFPHSSLRREDRPPTARREKNIYSHHQVCGSLLDILFVYSL